EDLDPLTVVRRVGDDEGPVRRHGECGRIDDAARLGADLDDFPGAREVIIEAEDGMAAAIEHECLPRVRLLESGDLTKSPGYVGWNGVDRLQHVRCERRQ